MKSSLIAPNYEIIGRQFGPDFLAAVNVSLDSGRVRELGAWGVSLHDDDLIPLGATLWVRLAEAWLADAQEAATLMARRGVYYAKPVLRGWLHRVHDIRHSRAYPPPTAATASTSPRC